MKFSVIMSSYNSEKTILESIRSVIGQAYSDLELIIVDGGSTDGTIKNIKSITDSRVRLYKSDKKSPGEVRNFGIRKAKGDYVLFCDSDDRLEKNILKKIAETNKDEKYDVILFRTKRVTEEGEVLIDNSIGSFEVEEEIRADLIKSIYNKFSEYTKLFGFDGVCGKVIRRRLLIENDLFFPVNIYRFEDAVFCKNIYQTCKNIYYLDEPGYFYVKYSKSLCNGFNIDAPKIFIDALKALYDDRVNIQDYFIKTLTTLTECEMLYFYNKEYTKKYHDYKKEYLRMINDRVYRAAISDIKYSRIPMHYKIEVFLLRHRMIAIYTILKKAYMDIGRK